MAIDTVFKLAKAQPSGSTSHRFFSAPIFLAGILLLIPGCATQSSTPPLRAKAIKVSGNVSWRTVNSEKWQPAEKNSQLAAPLTLETAKTSSVFVVFGPGKASVRSQSEKASSLDRTGPKIAARNIEDPNDGFYLSYLPNPDSFRLWENSRLIICELNRSSTNQWEIGQLHLELQTGHMVISVGKLSKDGSCTIALSDCDAALKKGTYGLEADGVVKVIDGSAMVTRRDGKPPQVVLGQQMFDVRTGVLSQLPME